MMITEYKLLEAKGNYKKSKVRKAQCMGTYYALKRISQDEESNNNNSSSLFRSYSSVVSSYIWSSPKADQSIFRECMLLYKLHHPNIVKATAFVKSHIDVS
jgi:serine/threonine protein kinase